MEQPRHKTIFISVFEGVEAKNLLRTSVVSTLLAHPDIRIVLLTKSVERAAYYKTEFADERLIYEVVERKSSKGLDAFFAAAKFTLLKTKSTDLKRFMAYQERGSYLAYTLGRVLNWLVARPSVRRFARVLDYYLVRNAHYSALFERYQPSVVLLAHLFDEPEVHLLREARRRKMRTVGLINSWDKTTSRAMLRLLPDTCIVFNEIVKSELIEHDEVLPENILVSGLPQYDYYADRVSVIDRAVFMEDLGIPSKHRLIVYAPLGSAFSTSDWKMIDRLHALRDSGVWGDQVSILVRFQPNDFIDERELKKRPHLIYDYPGKRFSSKRGVDWDMDEGDLRHLKDTLCHMSLLVCYASSMSIDAAVFDKPIININFEIEQPLHASKASTQYFKTDHYRKALATGGIRLVNTEGELITAIAQYLADPSLDRMARARLVKEQCGFMDGQAGKRIADELLRDL